MTMLRTLAMGALLLCSAGGCLRTPTDDWQPLRDAAGAVPEHSLFWVTRMSDFSRCLTMGMSDLVRLVSGTSGVPVHVVVVGDQSDTVAMRRLLTRERISADVRVIRKGRSLRTRIPSGVYLLEHNEVAAAWQLNPGRQGTHASSGRQAILDRIGL